MKKELRELLNLLEKGPTEVPNTSRLVALSQLTPEDQVEFHPIWSSLPTPLRRGILHALAETAEADVTADFTAIFRIALDDPDEEARLVALDGLWEDENPLLVQVLIRLLNSDPSAPVRASAATSLGRFAMLAELEELDPAVGATVRETLLATFYSKDDIEVRRRALEAVSCMDGDDIIAAIKRAYRDRDERMTVSAMFAMGRNADDRWTPNITKELRNPRPEVRFEAANAAGELELEDSVPTLLDLTNDPDAEVREAAVAALGNIGGERALQALFELSQSEDESIKSAAVDALGVVQFNENPLAPEIVTWLFDEGLSISDEDDDLEDWDELDAEDED
jgi:HEAT repeat protein